MQFEIEPYDPDQHGRTVYAIWEQVLGTTWPLSQPRFKQVMLDNDWYQPGDHRVAISGHAVIGFAATQAAPDQASGSIPLIMVRQEYQRQGVGSHLLQAATDQLQERGCQQIQLGIGGISNFWIGVPTNLSPAIAFFQHNGWIYEQTCTDMIGDLRIYHTPNEVYQRAADLGVTFHIANAQTAQDVLVFEDEHFPHWARYFRLYINAGDDDDVIFAADRTGTIVGTVLTFSRHSKYGRTDRQWQALLGDNMGGFGVLGVAEKARNQGIGMALTAYASDVLKSRGVQQCYIAWVWSVDWYAKLGFQVWRDYRMSRKSF